MTTRAGLAQLLVAKSLRVAQALVDPYAMASMNSSIRITRRGVWDEDKAEWDMTNSETVYADPDDDTLPAIAGVVPTVGGGQTTFGEEPETIDTVRVYIPRTSDARPMEDDVIEIWGCPDTDMVGRYFQIDSVPAGGRLLASIEMVATAPAPSRRWTRS